jgi:SH3-like domain-containing protein
MTSLRISICLLLAALAAPIFAQEYSPWVAEVTGDSVRLRSGPSMAHPPIHVLAQGDKLTVVAEQETWAVVRLPSAAPCWIALDFVQASGKTWVVTGNKVNLRVTADTKYFAVGQAETKDVLTAVCGEDGNPIVDNGFAKVIPPAQATGAVSVEFLKKTADTVQAPAKAEVEAPAATKEAAPEAPAKPLIKKDDLKREPTAKELEDEKKTFVELEKLLDDELKKPADKINLTGIRKMFEQFVDLALSADIRDKATGFVKKIDATVNLIEAEKTRLDKEAAERSAEVERIRKEAEKIGKAPVEEPKGPVEYIAIGTVGSHGKTAKTPASHRMFDENGNIVIDLRMDKGDLSKYMGSRVGVVGEIKEYAGWPQKVIVITRIDVIDTGEEK